MLVDGKETFRCKYCYSQEDLWFAPHWKKGDKPVRALDGRPHRCRKDRKTEIIVTKKTWKNDRREFYHDRTTKNKPQGWYLEVHDKPRFNLCGKCKTVLEIKSFDYEKISSPENREKTHRESGCICVLVGKNWCERFCPKCQEHPQIIHVTSSSEINA